MAYPINKLSAEIQQINFHGNVIPASWKNHLKLGKKIDLVGMWILSEIIYWYRPVIGRDEKGRETYASKYKSDFLQKSYDQLEESLGLTKSQVQDGLSRLENAGLIKKHFRTLHVQVPGSTDIRAMNNVMFIEIFPKKVQEITYSELKKSIPYTDRSAQGSGSMNTGVATEVQTYTETTSKTSTTETKGNDLANDQSMPFLDKKENFKEKQKFPLKKCQLPFLQKMIDLELNEPEEKLVSIIRKYTQDEKGIRLLNSAISHLHYEISKGTEFKKPRLAMFNAVLSGKISPVSELAIYNKSVAELAKDHHKWEALKIGDKSVTCRNSDKELSLDLDKNEFYTQLESLFELSKLY